MMNGWSGVRTEGDNIHCEFKKVLGESGSERPIENNLGNQS